MYAQPTCCKWMPPLLHLHIIFFSDQYYVEFICIFTAHAMEDQNGNLPLQSTTIDSEACDANLTTCTLWNPFPTIPNEPLQERWRYR